MQQHHTTRRRVAAVASLTAAVALGLAGPALADNIQDDIVDTGTGVSLAAGGFGVANVRVVANNSDGSGSDPGCNWDTGEQPLVLDVVTPAGVTANPDPVSITACGTDVPVTFTAGTGAVSGTATVRIVSSPAGGGGYNNQVSIPITITQPAPTNTPPVVAVTGVADGATYEHSLVPHPSCSVTDQEDSGEAATPVVTGGAYDDLGSHTATCSYTDGGQLTGSDSATYTVVRDTDTSAPAIGYTLTPAQPDGANGWYTGDVSLTWTVTEPESPETLAVTGCEEQSITSDQPATAYTCDASSEGGAAAQQSVSIKRDSQAPEAPTASLDPAANAAGWNNHDVTVSFASAGDHGPSGVDSCTADVTVDAETSARTVSGTCTDRAGNESPATVVTVRLDKTRPVIADEVTVQGTEGDNGWYTSDVDVTFHATDDRSGLEQETRTVTSSGEGAAVAVSSPTFTDRAGNTAEATSHTYKIDTTAPTNVAFAGVADYYFGDTQTTPSCTAQDATSGIASCIVTGGGTGVGTHTWTATATDRAGHTTTGTTTYQVKTWTTKGFHAPVDMGGVYNTVKGGSTVPLKFELFRDTTELTATSAIRSFSTSKVSCTTGGSEDQIEELATTGGTSLRYDATAGQFIQNWKTPTGAGTCYRATMTAADGSAISALFKIK